MCGNKEKRPEKKRNISLSGDEVPDALVVEDHVVALEVVLKTTGRLVPTNQHSRRKEMGRRGVVSDAVYAWEYARNGCDFNLNEHTLVDRWQERSKKHGLGLHDLRQRGA